MPENDDILDVIGEYDGIKAIHIARELGCTRRQVNSKLYRELSNYVWRDDKYGWHLRDDDEENDEDLYDYDDENPHAPESTTLQIETFSDDILDVIEEYDGIRAIQIAQILDCTRRQVNSKLYGELSDYVWKDHNHKWHLRDDDEENDEDLYDYDDENPHAPELTTLQIETYSDDILDVIGEYDGIRAIQIAQILDCTMDQVKSELYGELSDYVWQDDNYGWHLRDEDDEDNDDDLDDDENPYAPESTILQVKTYEDDEWYTIVDSINDQDSARKIYWIGRDISHRIIDAVFSGSQTFSDTDENRFQIQEVIEYPLFDEKHLNFIDCDEPKEILVYSRNPIDPDAEPVNALFYSDKGIKMMTVYFYNGEYFVNKETYELFRRQYGLPYVHLSLSPHENGNGFEGWSEQSDLYLYGYSVSRAAGLNTAKRHELLTDLIKGRLKSKAEIINHLEMLLFINKDNINMGNACDKWREDLMFVNRYNANNQRNIFGRRPRGAH